MRGSSFSSYQCIHEFPGFLTNEYGMTYPMAVDVRKVFQELVIPEIRELKLEVKGLQTEMKRLDEKIGSHHHEMKVEIGSFRKEMNAEIGSLRHEMRTELKRIDEKIDMAIHIRERFSCSGIQNGHSHQ